MRVLGLVVAIVIASQAAAPAAIAAPVVCSEQASVLVCDADADGIVDVVEEAVCGSATCATGAEDYDANGIPDATEFAESLAGGGAAGPVQLWSPSELIVVGPDGSIVQFSLWPFALGATVFLVAVALLVLLRRRGRGDRPVGSIGRHAARELS